MTTYIGILRKDRDSDFSVDFPDFPGCVTAAKTQSDVLHNAVEALALHIEGMIEDGDIIPEPTSIETLTEGGESLGGFVILVNAPVKRKSVRVNVSLDEGLLSRIAAVSDNRSLFLADAAREKLARENA